MTGATPVAAGGTVAGRSGPRAVPMRRLAWAAVAVAAVAVLAVALWPEASDPSVAARTRRLAAELRCPDCEGLSVAESTTAAARAARADIAARVRAGQSDAEIRQAFVDRYGEEVLLRPRADGLARWVWAGPAVVVLAGAAGVAWAVWRWRRPVPAAAGPSPPAGTGVPGSPGAPGPSSAAREVAGPGAARTARWRRLTVAALVVFAVAAGATVARTAGTRLPGEPLTGRAPAEARPEDRRRALRDAVAARPDDPAAHLALARFDLARGRYPAALRSFDEAARLDPTNAEALAYGGWIVRLAGLVDEGLARIDRAIAADPDYPDARFFRGVILLRDRSDPAGAIPELQRYLVAAPDGPMAGGVRQLLAEAVAARDGTPAPGTRGRAGG